MTQEEINKRNTAIALFMGATMCECCNPAKFKLTDRNWDAWNAKDLLYNRDWNWLMPVVEKIHLQRGVKEVVITPGRTRIWLQRSFIEVLSADPDSIDSPCMPENTSIIECFIAVSDYFLTINK